VTIDSFNKHLRLTLLAVIGIIFLLTLYTSYRQFIGNNPWTIGDWLINYQGGFVRRGLFGQFIYELHLQSGLQLGLIVMGVHWTFYTIFFYFAARIISNEKEPMSVLLLVISPFIFTYQIHSIEGGFRKEIIYLAALAFLSFTVSQKKKEHAHIPFYIIFSIFPLIILSHEMLAIFLPYLFALYFICFGHQKKHIITIALFSLPSMAALALAMKFQGGSIIVQAITDSLGENAPSEGAIKWMGYDSRYGFNQVMLSIREHNYFLRYLWCFTLASIAFIPFRSRLKELANHPMSLLAISSSILGTLALSVIAIDWGRFMYLNLVSIFFVALALTPKTNATNTQQAVTKIFTSHPLIIVLITVVSLSALVLYSIGWYIPHCCNWSPHLSDFTRKILSLVGIIIQK